MGLCVCSLCVVSSVNGHFGSAAETPFEGTWQGTFSSRNYESVPVTLIVTQGVGGKLTGAVNLISRCFRDADLQITINGSSIVLAGSDPEGATITVKGALDGNATQLATTYIVNGSASGKCETDDGSGTLTKR
jgi:hypothetical protein